MRTLLIGSLVLFLIGGVHAEDSRSVNAGELTLMLPTSWKQETPSSSMRLAQFIIPGESEGDYADMVIFFFGAQGGGGVQANLDRWIGQFAENGRKVAENEGVSKQGPYNMVDIQGTYNKPVGPPMMGNSKPIAGQQMLAVVLQKAGGNYFLKLTGPEKTVSQAKQAFKASFGAE